MAYVKVRFSKNAAAKLAYIQKSRAERDVVDVHDCTIENAAESFATTRSFARGQSDNECLHIVQSWSPKESALRRPEEFNAIGKKLVEDLFPGHQYVIRTHTDKPAIHNHMVVNLVHSETGKRIKNKKSLIKDVREHSDKLCLENGLSVIDGRSFEDRAHLPYKVQQMVRFNKPSYVYDLVQKADFARQYSANYDEYRRILSELDIRTVLTNKNITYFYPGREKGKRGSKLGKRYDKEGLESSFERNRQMYAERPEKRSDLAEGIAEFRNGCRLNRKAYEHDLRPANSARSGISSYPSERELSNTFAPVSEIARARRESIPDYCHSNKIALRQNTNGEKVLWGRDYVVITDYECRNTKNGTRGSLIDFVAAHKNVSFLKAVALINNNPRLLEFEKHLGEAKRTYTSFYIPRSQQADSSVVLGRLTDLMKAFGANPNVSHYLQERGQAQANRTGKLRLFAREDDSAAIEFEKVADGSWSRKSYGKAHRPFFETSGRSKTAIIFTDPISLLRQFGTKLFWGPRLKFEVLGLLEADERLSDQFLAGHKQIDRVFFVASTGPDRSGRDLDFFNVLHRRYAHFGIDLKLFTDEKELSKAIGKEGRDFGLSL